MTRARRSRLDPAEYERKTYPKLGGRYASEVEISDVLRLSGKTSTALEVGMGTGRVFTRLATRSAYLVGIDPDVSMAKHTSDRMTSSSDAKQPNFDLLVADGEHLPFRDAVFDSVVCVRVLRYFDGPGKAIENICRVLRPRGRLVLEFTNILRPQTLLQIPRYLLHREFYPRLFERKRVEKWISGRGMRINQVLGWHKLPVELLGLTNNQSFLRALVLIERILQRISPPEFMSRSLVVSATKE